MAVGVHTAEACRAGVPTPKLQDKVGTKSQILPHPNMRPPAQKLCKNCLGFIKRCGPDASIIF